MHPAVEKAQRIGRIAKENGWHGRIDSEMVNSGRATQLNASRNDEHIVVCWSDNSLSGATYTIIGKTFQLHCSKQVLEKVKGWPDLVDLFKWFPEMNRPELVEKYRRLPFNWREDNDEEIMSKLIGRKIFWYSHMTQRMASDVVLEPKGKKANKFEIRHIGHRKMFNFISAGAGFRSVLLDTLVKVA